MSMESNWYSYFAAEGEAGRQRAALIRSRAVEARLLEPHWDLISTPLSFDRASMQALEGDLLRLLALWLEVPERFFGGDISRCAAQFGYSEAITHHIVRSTQVAIGRGAGPGTEVLCRWDLAFAEEGEGFRVHELNIGSNTGAMGMTLLGNIYREICQRAPAELPPACQAERAWEASLPLAETLAREVDDLPAEECLAIVEDDSCFADIEASLTALRALFERVMGRPVVAARSSALKATAGGLVVDGKKVGAIYSYFTVEDVVAKPELYGPIMEAVYSGRVRHPMAFPYIPFGNKLIMAVLSEAAESGALGEQERQLVQRYLPWTRRLNADTLARALERQQTLVAKPADSFGGIGVMCGWEMLPEEWKAALERVVTSQEPHVIQEQARSEHASLGFVCADGRTSLARVRPVVGLYMVGRRLSGGLARASHNDIGVLNVKNGAAIGAVMIRE